MGEHGLSWAERKSDREDNSTQWELKRGARTPEQVGRCEDCAARVCMSRTLSLVLALQAG